MIDAMASAADGRLISINLREALAAGDANAHAQTRRKAYVSTINMNAYSIGGGCMIDVRYRYQS